MLTSSLPHGNEEAHDEATSCAYTVHTYWQQDDEAFSHERTQLNDLPGLPLARITSRPSFAKIGLSLRLQMTNTGVCRQASW